MTMGLYMAFVPHEDPNKYGMLINIYSSILTTLFAIVAISTGLRFTANASHYRLLLERRLVLHVIYSLQLGLVLTGLSLYMPYGAGGQPGGIFKTSLNRLLVTHQVAPQLGPRKISAPSTALTGVQGVPNAKRLSTYHPKTCQAKYSSPY
ncbi:uncharacterized protein F5891DRAFT_1251284 [Suillus fuscotomentosus]|uniref:Uncharacterized protein n=1 Tax=Suillus fuscotomentosus TaxID=1912939 RepID=A0AAD4DXE9_9AGAM|nr:uncharacterized protein F5891DRAFT_1251284 [Suillus fuscotomentosus]KAG1895655.1 hypothetical protein F5891DRAFT_1251284 [Suillus fuscotomentosus]